MASEEGDSQVRLTESTHTGAKPQTPRICSKIAEELGLSSREGVIRDQSAKKIAKKPYCPHQRAQGDFLFQLELKLCVRTSQARARFLHNDRRLPWH